MIDCVAKVNDSSERASENVATDPTRRALLGMGGAAALALVAAKSQGQIRGGGQTKTLPPGIGVTGNWSSVTNRLLRRITYGLDPVEKARVESIGFQSYLDEQLAPESIDDTVVQSRIDLEWPKVRWSEAELYDDTDQWDQFLQVNYAWMHRSAFSKRQLYERMVEFWTDHFNVSIQKLPPPLLTAFIEKAIRPNAMGSFFTLLRATARTSGMMNFLDNDQNNQYAPNINYSRELHELHTVGVTGGYTGQDLRQAALILTGWSWTYEPGHPNRNKFTFRFEQHASGTKVVMGQTYESAGYLEGERLLTYLANHAKTAEFVSGKMVRWFLGDNPSQSVLNAAKNTFLLSGGNIKEVLRVILTANNLSKSSPRYKRPYHLLISTVRPLEPVVADWYISLYLLYLAGQAPWGWSFPDGYPDRFDYWVGGQIHRMNYGFLYAANYVDGVAADILGKFGSVRTADACTNSINQVLFGGEMSTTDREALRKYFQAEPIDDYRLYGGVALAMNCPSFQWY